MLCSYCSVTANNNAQRHQPQSGGYCTPTFHAVVAAGLVEFVEVLLSLLVDVIKQADVLARARQVRQLSAARRLQLTLLHLQLLVDLAVLLQLFDEAPDACKTFELARPRLCMYSLLRVRLCIYEPAIQCARVCTSQQNHALVHVMAVKMMVQDSALVHVLVSKTVRSNTACSYKCECNF